MKKTLALACMLLAPSVLADTLPSTYLGTSSSGITVGTSSTGGNASITWTATEAVDTTLQSWMITFEVTNIENGYSHWPTVSVDHTMSNNNPQAAGLSIIVSDDALFGFAQGGTAYDNVNPWLTNTPTLAATVGNTYTFAYDATAEMVYLADITAGSMIEMSLANLALATELTSGEAWSWSNSKKQAYNFTTVTDMSSVSELGSASFAATVLAGDGNVHVVPEPATATLSLLALAGLAARRRRS